MKTNIISGLVRSRCPLKVARYIRAAVSGSLFIVCASSAVLAQSWGVERGRASEADVARLLVDQLVMTKVHNQLRNALGRETSEQRQADLVAITLAHGLNNMKDYWLKHVMGPGLEIVRNPAANCKTVDWVLTGHLLTMMRQRQLMGLPDQDDSDLIALWSEIVDLGEKRCQEEALDECLVTGRFMQIIQLEMSLNRQSALLGVSDRGYDIGFIKDALEQCAIYELRFESTTKVSQIFNLETGRRSKIRLKFKDDANIGGFMFGQIPLKELLKGETAGDVLLDSAKCSQPGLKVSCKPGAILNQNFANVIDFDFKHREYDVNENGSPQVRTAVGEDKFPFEFGGGIYGVDARIEIPFCSKNCWEQAIPIPMPGIGYGFYTAHRKDRLGTAGQEGQAVKVAVTPRQGVYPIIFDLTYTDSNTESNASASDRTEFKLVHKPEPEALPSTEEKERKPLRPSRRIKLPG